MHSTLTSPARTAILATLTAVTVAVSFSAQDGPVVCWDGSPTTVCNTPPGNFVQVSAGGHGLGLRCDGTIECWGGFAGPGGECNVPPGTFLQVAAGGNHSVALRTDGTLACWGDNDWGQSTPPPGDGKYLRVAAGMDHCLAIKEDGTLVTWGRDSWGLDQPPAGTFIDIAAGYYNSVAIRSDKSIVCWGDNSTDQLLVPTGAFKQVAMGEWGGAALRTDGTLACWGWDPYYQQCDNMPPGTFTQVSTSFNHIVALRPNGTAVCWTSPFFEDCAAPPAGPFSQISAGGNYTLGITEPTITEINTVDQCTVQLTKWGDGVGDWPAQQGIAFDGTHFYTSGGTCTGSEAASPMRIIKWDPSGDGGWSVVKQNKEVGGDPLKPTCHIGGIDVEGGFVYAVLSDFGDGGPLSTGYLGCYKALDLSPQWALDMDGLIANYDFEDFAGVAVGPSGFLYVVTYQSDPDKNTLVFKLNPNGGLPEAVYELDTRKANGIDIVDGVTYVSVDLCPGLPCGLPLTPAPRAAVEVYEELCIFGPSKPDERRIYEMPPGAYYLKHGEGLAVVSDDEIWTAEWTHATKIGGGGQPGRFCGTAPAGMEGDVNAVSLGTGGKQNLGLDLGSFFGGQVYLTLGSATGISPGTPFGPDSIPLNFDAYSQFTLSHPNTPPLEQSFGVLDGGGAAVISISFPAGFDPALAGTELHHVSVIFDLAGGPAVSFASSPVPLVLLP